MVTYEIISKDWIKSFIICQGRREVQGQNFLFEVLRELFIYAISNLTTDWQVIVAVEFRESKHLKLVSIDIVKIFLKHRNHDLELFIEKLAHFLVEVCMKWV